MRRNTVSGTMLVLLLISVLLMGFIANPVSADLPVHNIDTGEDFSTIQNAIDDPDTGDGHTILVDAGSYGYYYWNPLRLYKSLEIVGEDPSNTVLWGGVKINASNVRFTGFSIRGGTYWGINHVGIWLQSSHGCAICSNSLEVCGDSIMLFSSSFNMISENRIIEDWGHFGIRLHDSHSNLIIDNNMSGNLDGIYFYEANNNLIRSNSIVENRRSGIMTVKSSINTICHNSFINNGFNYYKEHVVSSSSYDVWDDGATGNYWSGYEERYPDAEEIDDSGIWNHPYVIDEHNQDNYPLVEPWSAPTMIKTLIRTIEFSGLPQGTGNSLTSKLEGALHLLNQGNENGAMHKLMDFTNQVEVLRGKKLTNEQADYLISEAQRIIGLIEG